MAGASKACSPDILLTDEELLVTRPNYRVIRLEVYSSLNKKGKPYQVCCDQDNLNPTKAQPVCLYQNRWHTLLTSRKGISGLGDPLSDFHRYDIDSPITALSEVLEEEPLPRTLKPPKDDEEQPTSPTSTETTTQSHTENQRLQLAPIPEHIRTSPIISPAMVTMTKMYAEGEVTTGIPADLLRSSREGGGDPKGPPPEGDPDEERPFRRRPLREDPPDGGGPPGGGPPFGGGLPLGPDAQRRLEIKPIGQLPLIFDRDRTKSEAFLDALKAYFRLNHQVPAFNSYLTRIALALTLI